MSLVMINETVLTFEDTVNSDLKPFPFYDQCWEIKYNEDMFVAHLN